MNRLHVPRSELSGDTVVVRGAALSYLRDVLRLRPGAPLEVFDGEGGVHASTLDRFVEDGALLQLGPRVERPDGAAKVVLWQGLPKADKFELVVQKAVELGVSAIVPVGCERSVVKLDAKKAADRVERWQKIADEAARQCGRADVATIEPVTTLEAALRLPAGPEEVRLLLDEEEKTVRLRDALAAPDRRYVVLVGPEGGFTRGEVEAAARAGFTRVTLGPRILRTETVGLAVLSVIQHVLGDFG